MYVQVNDAASRCRGHDLRAVRDHAVGTKPMIPDVEQRQNDFA